ncbi:MAG: type II toxin-antitoxin system YafQ family toxin [Spirochaetales bacterium]|nr:type II toxin-antitoxin system YafQ family toxin [Spirochaetales bacterium]
MYRECHILSNLLLVYLQDEDFYELFLYRIGSHSELFN